MQERRSLCLSRATAALHGHASRRVRAWPMSAGLEKPSGLGVAVITSLLCKIFLKKQT